MSCAGTGEGFAAEHFKIDWETQSLTCPAGKTSTSWTSTNNTKGKPVFRIRFPLRDCKPCAFRSSCTTAKARTVTLQVRERHEALVAARAREETDAFKVLYAKRAGIEGSISVGVRAFELRRSRYVGLAKTCLQHLAMASAIPPVRCVLGSRSDELDAGCGSFSGTASGGNSFGTV